MMKKLCIHIFFPCFQASIALLSYVNSMPFILQKHVVYPSKACLLSFKSIAFISIEHAFKEVIYHILQSNISYIAE